MPKTKSPRKGSMGYWPRKRAKRIYPRTKTWPKSEETKLLGFAGYKAGMTHSFVVETNTNSKLKGQHIMRPVTILECPPLSVFGFRCYNDSRSVCDVLADKFSKYLGRKLKVPTKGNTEEQMKKVNLEKTTHINLLCHSNPPFKKTPEVFEIAIGGELSKQLEYAKEQLGKEIKISDMFKDGDYIDVSGVTKGKGYQGPVKRFGVKIQYRKNEQAHRHIGTHGTKEPGKIRITVPDSGQMGFHTRTDFNKRILKITEGKEINPRGGFVGYGLIKNDCVVIDGTVPGPRKRLVRIRQPIRLQKTVYPVDVQYISRTSKQGR
ncbi:MAG: 50S ribosomal protein L3 [Candidatus Aenigmarchaeota archaeon]|nr:50S ribosomal protein L3 [Candidatus Aenigmarchaeota archaeon]